MEEFDTPGGIRTYTYEEQVIWSERPLFTNKSKPNQNAMLCLWKHVIGAYKCIQCKRKHANWLRYTCNGIMFRVIFSNLQASLSFILLLKASYSATIVNTINSAEAYYLLMQSETGKEVQIIKYFTNNQRHVHLGVSCVLVLTSLVLFRYYKCNRQLDTVTLSMVLSYI